MLTRSIKQASNWNKYYRYDRYHDTIAIRASSYVPSPWISIQNRIYFNGFLCNYSTSNRNGFPSPAVGDSATRQDSDNNAKNIAAAQAAVLKQSSQLRRKNSLKERNKLSRASSAMIEELMKLIQGLHSPDEIHYYLQQYKKFNGPTFAIIKIGSEIVNYDLNVLCASCAILQSIGLTPVIVHGGRWQVNKELHKRGIKPDLIDGYWVTNESILDVAVNVFNDINNDIVQSLTKMGAEAKGYPVGVYDAEMKRPELGYVGRITGVNTDDIVKSLRIGEIPVLSPIGYSKELGKHLYINSDVSAREIAIKLKPMRVVIVDSNGGWIDPKEKKVLSVVDVNREYEKLAGMDYSGWEESLLQLREIKYILESLPRTSTVSIASASAITKELFTHSGGGTLFLKQEKIHRYKTINDNPSIDKEKINALFLEDLSSITTAVPDHGLHFDAIQSVIDAIYVSESYNACGIVTTRKIGYDNYYYLENLSIEPVAHGTGLYDALWRQIKSDYPSLAWKCNNWNEASSDFTNYADATLYDHATDTIVGWYARSYQQIPQGIGRWDMGVAKTLLAPESLPSEIAYLSQDYESRMTSTDSSSSNILYGNESNLPKIKVGLIGVRGYIGREFVKLLAQHPRLELSVAASRVLHGRNVSKLFNLPDSTPETRVSRDLMFEMVDLDILTKNPHSKEVDVWVIALPDGLAPAWVSAIKNIGKKDTSKIIDLGADHRMNSDWVYGLPEKAGVREKLASARMISAPGCFATGIQLSLMPLYQPDDSESEIRVDTRKGIPMVFGVTGYSGVGTMPSDANNLVLLRDNIMPFMLHGHLNQREASHHLKTDLSLFPHVASFFQGINLTVSTHLLPIDDLNGKPKYPDSNALLEHYKSYYANERLIQPTQGIPRVNDVMKRHVVNIGGFSVDNKTGRFSFVCTIDNLLKGGATQLMQILNIAYGMNELTGIKID